MDVKWSREFVVPPDDQDGMCGVKFEDGTQAAIMYHAMDEPVEQGGDGCFFVRLHSWDEADDLAARHPLFRSLMGRTVRVTVETIGDAVLPPRGPTRLDRAIAETRTKRTKP